MFADHIYLNETLNQLNESLLNELLSQSLQSEQQNMVIDVAKSSLAARVIICLIYALIFVLSIPGNSLVVYVILRKPEMRSVTNIFIINLAVSDILMTLTATPLTPAIIFLDGWSLNVVICKMLSTIMAITVYVSTLTSTAIAIERCIVTDYRSIPKARGWITSVGIVSTWVVSTICSSPLAIFQDVCTNPHTNTTICRENWPQTSSRAHFTIASFCLQFVVPCAIITLCYSRIGCVLHNRAYRKIGTKTRSKEEAEVRRKRRVIKMLVAMVVVFVVCWIPLNCLWMVIDLGIDYRPVQEFASSGCFNLVFFICHIFAMSSAVYNPFVYTWMNEVFRKELCKLMPPCCLRWKGLITKTETTVKATVSAVAGKE